MFMEKVLVINCSPVKTGATNKIIDIVIENLKGKKEIKKVCIDDYRIEFCKGCRSCHITANCPINDDVTKLMDEFEWADKIVCVSPSYWADIPGQFKVFIDRCTPWCNTHDPYRKLSSGKKGYAVALRTGPSYPETERIISSIEHFYGHLEIERAGKLAMVSVEYKGDVDQYLGEIEKFCETIK